MAVATERSAPSMPFKFGPDSSASENSVFEDAHSRSHRLGTYQESQTHSGVAAVVAKDKMEVSLVAAHNHSDNFMRNANSETTLLSKQRNFGRKPGDAFKCSSRQTPLDARITILRVSNTDPVGLIHGLKESPGFRTKMEDRTTFLPNFMEISILSFQGERLVPDALPVLRSLNPLGQGTLPLEKKPYFSLPESSFVYSTLQFDFAAVYDGHGGHSVSETLSQQLHDYIKANLVRHMNVPERSSAFQQQYMSPSWNQWNPTKGLDAGVEGVRAYLNSQDVCQARDGFEKSTVACKTIDYFGGPQVPKGIRQPDPPSPIRQSAPGQGDAMVIDSQVPAETKNLCPLSLLQLEQAIIAGFEDMNENLPDAKNKTIGSTAVVTMISKLHMIVANVGDSRCVLAHGGLAYRVTRDHKPDQEDEEERILRHGGRVWDFNGRRVMGLLAMTRAFGDDCLKEFGITAKPEVTILPRSQDDEFLILACDGLWDVVTDDEACNLVRRCFARAEERQAGQESACRVATSVLTRAAFDKGSNDNVSVMVVDLRTSGKPLLA